MCCRAAQISEMEEFFALYGVEDSSSVLAPRFNISPGMEMSVLTGNKIEPMLWGKLANARSETVYEKFSFKESIKSRRCIIPVNAFYEWKNKQPYCFMNIDKSIISLAGIWNRDGFSVLTTDPNETMRPIHNRMPVILDSKKWEQWLDQKTQVQEILQPASDDLLRAWPVTPQMNKTEWDQPECFKEIAVTGTLF
ncbi:MAG: SOS response-associated peptidase [bacterium]|nr:SOS response-associated peptidase [bacterium]